MISASVVVDGHAHGLGPSPHHHAAHVTPPHHAGVHMTFTEPFLLAGASGTANKAPAVQEFVRPLPKPKPVIPRYNGVLNGFRTPGRVSSAVSTAVTSSVKYQEPSSSGPVNLVQHNKDDEPHPSPPHPPPPAPSSTATFATPIHATGAGFSTRLYQPYHYPNLPGPYGSLYPGHYTPLIPRPPYSQPSPVDGYRQSPPQPAPAAPPIPSAAPYVPYSQSTTTTTILSPRSAQSSVVVSRPFKVPSGREGSLKHRILTRPTVEVPSAKRRCTTGNVSGSNGITSTITSSATATVASTTATVMPNFAKGALIQLANGVLKRVEDMRTEDFVDSAQQTPGLQLDPSTVVRISEDSIRGTAVLTVSYSEHRVQAEIETTVEHPFFVYNRGWSSCSPERTRQSYGLECHRLQVGDVCISLTPRTRQQNNSPKSVKSQASQSLTNQQRQRRWSAPDQFPEDGAPPNPLEGPAK